MSALVLVACFALPSEPIFPQEDMQIVDMASEGLDQGDPTNDMWNQTGDAAVTVTDVAPASPDMVLEVSDAMIEMDLNPLDAGTSCVPSSESCDGLDNDCDTRIDESDDQGGACRCISVEEKAFDFCHRAVTWPRALAACGARGGSLVVIRSAEEMATLAEAMEAREAEFALADYRAWIGLNDREVEGQFVWANGDASEFRDWHPQEPNDIGDEDCVSILKRDGRVAWYDLSCGQELVFICIPE